MLGFNCFDTRQYSYTDTKLPRFSSGVNWGDKGENTAGFVLLSATLTHIICLILTLCLILTFPQDGFRKKKKNHGNTINFLQISMFFSEMCSRMVHCTAFSRHSVSDQVPSPKIQTKKYKRHLLGVEVKIKNWGGHEEKKSGLNSAQICRAGLFFFGLFNNFRTLVPLRTQKWII